MREDSGMPAVSTLDELRAAVADFAVTSLDLPYESTALTAARTSLDEAGLLLLGEVHGVAENPRLIADLMRALQITSLALEWPVDLADTVESFLRTGTLTDHRLLWLGDGRVTAGYLSLLRDRYAAGPLRLTLFDPPMDAGADLWTRHDAAMATRLLTSAAAHTPTLAVAGNAHTPTTVGEYGVPMGAHLAASRPAVREIAIRYRAGRYYNFAPRRFHRRPRLAPRGGLYASRDGLVAELPMAHEAVVPHQPGHHPTSRI